MIESAFELEGDSYHRILISKAVDISNKSVDFRNELVAAVDEARFQDGHYETAESILRDSVVNPVEARSNPEEVVAKQVVEPTTVVSKSNSSPVYKKSLF